jgi:peptide/nickel transport system substrate-binding protein
MRSTKTKRRAWRLAAAMLALGLIAAACGDDGGNDAASTGSSGTGGTGASATGKTGATAATTTVAPVKGGIATIGQFSTPPGLDPIKMAGGGTVGGMEHAAMWDTIVSYDAETGKYTPRTGEFTANADFTVWTLKLKSGIKFADGTAYNADAVKFVVSREMKDGNSAPKGQLLTFLDADPEKSIKVVDPLTVQFNLKLAWSDFQYMFATVQGWIYSPTEFQRIGAEAFNTNTGKAGAGPFMLKSFKAGESIELERNPNYWGGDVYLDGLVFKLLNGPQATYDAIKGGTLQAGYIRDSGISATAKKDGFGQILMPAIAGNIINMNSGAPVACKGGQPAPLCTGKPDGNIPSTAATVDKNVRLAVAAAVDPKVINERVYSGAGQPNSAPFANSPWDPNVAGPKADLAEAKRLVGLAKTAGWNGKIRLLTGTDPVGLAWGQAVAPQLQAAGMEVELINKPTSEIVNQVIVAKDYDLATWAYGMVDEFPANYVQLAGSFAAPNGRYGYSTPEMVAAVDKMRTAGSQTERVAAVKAVSEVWVKDMPAHVITTVMQTLVMTPKLQGALRTAGSNVLFDKAFLQK